ncbi:major facilitator superfamily domain-containing protein [Lipomyces tetrasporus]|uniref:Major facilitator superfamily domain-containing protein n=1 Tax=Lipomyces tetrasporus TaxID=54092 RepID=A0AAD7QZI4_9ASCO|nr:major facilitator superfamily domain-containing protein [Lipomyces tetrasporus]KAJ8104359.1 major facilitator superfamily domain-containing protein [Lipomyces tetrasporus]
MSTGPIFLVPSKFRLSLTQSAFVLVSGRLGAVYGHQKLLLLGGAIIVVFSTANAFCNTYDSFVAVRALTGVGGGILMPYAVATLTIMVPPTKARNITLAAFAASPPVGALIGALLAGVFLQYTAWKWHFILIACFGTFVFGGLFFVLPHEEPVEKNGKTDCRIRFGRALTFQHRLEPGALRWIWNTICDCHAGAVSAAHSFFIWECRYASEPIMPLTVFHTPSFNALIFVILFIYMSVGILLWYMVAWQQLIRGWTVLQVAIGWIPFGIGASMGVTLAAWLIPRLEAQYVLALGCLTSVVSTVLLAAMPEQQLYWAQVFPSTFLGSFCPDFVYVAAQIIASNSVGKREQGVAGSLIGTLHLYGNSLGLDFAATIEVQIAKYRASEVLGFRAALWFGVALATTALILDLVFVRMPKDDREGWKSSEKRNGEVVIGEYTEEK